MIVLFGATGDLAKRKLLPGLYHLFVAGLLPEKFRDHRLLAAGVRGVGRRLPRPTPSRPATSSEVASRGAPWDKFAARLSFAAASPEDPSPLVAAVEAAEKAIGNSRGHGLRQRRNGALDRAAVPPGGAAVGVRVGGGDARRVRAGQRELPGDHREAVRLATWPRREQLNEAVHKVFDESQIFRIDHFLGKESVDNILAFRFANGLFEPIWNRQHIKYVQIDVPETLTDRGAGGFYDATGAYRDMVVTHLFQVLGFMAMEPPTSLAAKPLRDEKGRCSTRSSRSTCGTSCAGSTRATESIPGCLPTPTPRR